MDDGIFKVVRDPFFSELVTVDEVDGWLNFESDLMVTGQQRIYIRSSYKSIADQALSKDEPGMEKKYAVVTGTPRVGKSVFLYYVMWRLVKEGKRVLFLTEEPPVYFDGSGAGCASQVFVEERVAQARLEAVARTQALVCAINQAYGDPMALERRVDDRIQRVLTMLQDASLSQAREMASAALRAEQAVQTLMANLNDEFLQLARAVAVSEVDIRLGQAMAILEERVVRRAESHVLGLVKSLLEENRRQWQRQLMELQHLVEERLEQRLRETIVVAKKAAEAQAREVISESAGESTSLKIARLQAQQDVAERALQRAAELKAIAARELAEKRAQKRTSSPAHIKGGRPAINTARPTLPAA
ncbi:hypothetical protein PHYSODRAFT_326803 [Phytophthora sojae]|uniref:Uncharacterized protein n=1 Tax=Phytophthora sojae (strain P6497) TaxID=1094619 RepID=G4Z0I7_PHYSP|nr:hypothetical protein PHYSODRAFT_326803 [Phytophthora sojae]EGZ25836.1 hypothetical protein PHYSODRAFT_326803 [Phytophthora sojae]|eukprot:XP_009521124.1 hypothetical protein PHYSODRAFT_326803 [Phytophthora sojae]